MMTPSILRLFKVNGIRLLAAGTLLSSLTTVSMAEEVPRVAALSRAESSRATASQQNKYTFIMFYKDQDDATKSMWNTLSQNLNGKKETTSFVAVNTNDPKEQKIIEEYGVSRAPMPLTLAVAPNGAITGSFVKQINDDYIQQAFVSATKARCMLNLQSRKMVLLCVNPGGNTGVPAGVEAFKAIPCYKDVVEVVTVDRSAPGEGDFLKELEVPASQESSIVFMAPPGVMIGQYSGKVTSQQLIAELKKAGKSCGVEGCKHCKE
ncbi:MULTISPECIES: hypothetical protein [Gimesia]|uniref:hypothetical protein n=1 Tax=Gimesia TaxID=1649453 RepID=UPI000C63CC0E|nr:hypothetical protein [Gimesia chilikensis]MBN72769.1 hypothetical protein [Gimesia sp.]MCR9230950.1 hypothetical protein [bacterium]QDT87291.1 hypothetical protein MalM14_49760 [Gimesia chilikensis]